MNNIVKALIDRNSDNVDYWMGPISELAAAVICRAYLDYLKGTPEQKQDAYDFLVKEECGMWKDFVGFAPGWNKDIVPPEEQTGLTEEEKAEAVKLYREGMIAVRGLSIKFKCPFPMMSSYIKSVLSPAEIRHIEETRKERQFKGVIRDRLSGVSTHNAALFNHVAQWRVLDWFRTYLIKKGVIGKDYTRFLQELSKRDRGEVREQADRWIEEL